MEKLMRTSEVAKYLNIDERTVLLYAKKKILPVEKILPSGQYRFCKNDIIDFARPDRI